MTAVKYFQKVLFSDFFPCFLISKSKSLPAVAETSLPFASELYYVHMYEQYTRHICNNGLFYYFLIVLCDYQ